MFVDWIVQVCDVAVEEKEDMLAVAVLAASHISHRHFAVEERDSVVIVELMQKAVGGKLVEGKSGILAVAYASLGNGHEDAGFLLVEDWRRDYSILGLSS